MLELTKLLSSQMFKNLSGGALAVAAVDALVRGVRPSLTVTAAGVKVITARAVCVQDVLVGQGSDS